ncbi:MAG: PAS-domain containing protein [Rhodobacteraceae bacterium]|nr:PAS-domain containing protein [Paracoccaceae bacterium]
MPAAQVSTGLFLLAISLFSAFSAVLVVGRRPRVSPKGVNIRSYLTDSDQAILAASQLAELADLQEVIEFSPVLTWRTDSNGSVTWGNRAYLDQVKTLPDDESPKPDALPDLFGPLADLPKSMRKQIVTDPKAKPLWFEVVQVPMKDDSGLNFALHADSVVHAEEALRNFIQTLTKTFAHLPIGLAIFDRNRQLALFNPALADLTTLEPQWLTARPTLYAFLDRLRDIRKLPEPKNYKSWRDRISALEKAAEDGSYEETWPLPTGQTFRVTGRPHPEGAVAFLFEDITSAITLQRQFRAELELSQSVLDSLDEALAVFSSNGQLVMNNDAYAGLWKQDPREMLATQGAAEACEIWQSNCRPVEAFDDFRRFAASGRNRSPWRKTISTGDGRYLSMRVTMLPRAAYLVGFQEIDPAQVQVRGIAPQTAEITS